MFISNGVLTKLDASDIDANGVLRIPFGVTEIAQQVGDNMPQLRHLYLPESLCEIYGKVFNNNPYLESIYFGANLKNLSPLSFINCPLLCNISIPKNQKSVMGWVCMNKPKLKSVQITDSKNDVTVYPVAQYFGTYYYESRTRQFGNYTLRYLHRLNWHDTGKKFISTNHQFGISSHGHTFVRPTVSGAISDLRKYELKQEFERAIWEYKAANPHMTRTVFDWETILRNSVSRTFDQWFNVNVARRKMLRTWNKNIDLYAHELCNISKKYPNTENKFYELESLNMPNLLHIIDSRPPRVKNCPSCTRWLTKHPVNPDTMHAIVMAGYKNPGAFPYSWLMKIPDKQRGYATKRLHIILKKFAIKLYQPSTTSATPQDLSDMANAVSNIIHQPIEIKYLGAGDFAKTYTMQVPNDKKYVWKIYHCDRTSALLNKYNHNTELQNSFLMGGMRYYGKTKFRKISTAGISNQRGEIYLIYPYTDAAPSMRRIYKPFEMVSRYSLTDRNSDNFRGHTVIDMGALYINHPAWSQPQYVSKIIRTVLYHSWNDLGYVLNNYTSKQIAMALSFMSGKISHYDLNYQQIYEKIKFLRQGAKLDKQR